MEGKLIYIQLGNPNQCADNGIPEWQYVFGRQGHRLRGTHNYECIAVVNERRQTGRWSVKKQHHNTFKLTLTMEKLPTNTNY